MIRGPRGVEIIRAHPAVINRVVNDVHRRSFRGSRLHNLVAGDGLHPSAFQIVIAAVEHFARLRKLGEVSLYDILHKLVTGSAPALGGQVIQLLFRLGGKVYFHALHDKGNPGSEATFLSGGGHPKAHDRLTLGLNLSREINPYTSCQEKVVALTPENGIAQ